MKTILIVCNENTGTFEQEQVNTTLKVKFKYTFNKEVRIPISPAALG